MATEKDRFILNQELQILLDEIEQCSPSNEDLVTFDEQDFVKLSVDILKEVGAMVLKEICKAFLEKLKGPSMKLNWASNNIAK